MCLLLVHVADSLIGTGFPIRRRDNFKRRLKRFEAVLQRCAGLRRSGAAGVGWTPGATEPAEAGVMQCFIEAAARDTDVPG